MGGTSAVEIFGVTGRVEIGADALGGLRIDRERIAAAALADDAQRIEAPIFVKVADTHVSCFQTLNASVRSARYVEAASRCRRGWK